MGKYLVIPAHFVNHNKGMEKGGKLPKTSRVPLSRIAEAKKWWDGQEYNNNKNKAKNKAVLINRTDNPWIDMYNGHSSGMKGSGKMLVYGLALQHYLKKKDFAASDMIQYRCINWLSSKTGKVVVWSYETTHHNYIIISGIAFEIISYDKNEYEIFVIFKIGVL